VSRVSVMVSFRVSCTVWRRYRHLNISNDKKINCMINFW